ncbi:MAG: hypothetical protein R3F39_21685 [Myxococcota bacterium]
MKTMRHPLIATLGVVALTLTLAAGCDDGGGTNGADGTVKTDVAAGPDGTIITPDGTTGTPDGTTGTPDGTTGTPDGTTGTPDGTTGNDTTGTPDTNPPAPFCGDTLCNGGESQLTCPGDCGGTVSPTSLLCFELNGCLAAQCAALPVAEQNACANAAINAGGACPSAAGELPLFLADNQCLVQNCGSETTAAGQAACIGAKCAGTQATCNAGTVKGSGTCGALQTCIQTCLVGGQVDAPCARTCYSATSQGGLELDVKLNYCLLAACASAPTQAQLQQCAQAALAPTGTCGPARAACLADGTVVVADPTPDASGDISQPDAGSDTSTDTTESDASPDTTEADTAEDAGPLPDSVPTPDAASDASGAGFSPFFGERFFRARFGQGHGF